MLSLSPLTVLPCSPLEQIDAAQAAGFDAVGLRLVPGMETDIEIMADPGLRREIARRLAAADLKVLDVEVVRISPHTDLHALVPALEYAGDLGARNITVTTQPRAEYLPAEEPLMVGKLTELCELAARHRIRPMIEFMVFRGVASLEDALRIVKRVDHPGLGICVDALHLFRSGGTAASLAGVNPALLHCLQICDAPLEPPSWDQIPAEARRGRLYPGEGELPLSALLQVMPKDIPVSAEAPCISRAGQSVAARADELARCTRKLLESAGRS